MDVVLLFIICVTVLFVFLFLCCLVYILVFVHSLPVMYDYIINKYTHTANFMKRGAHVNRLLTYQDAVSGGVFFIDADVHDYERREAV